MIQEKLFYFAKSVSTEYTSRFSSERTALIICCAYLDLPFYAALHQSITENNTVFTIGAYIRQLQMCQYRHKSFFNSLLTGELKKDGTQIKEEREQRWSRSDTQNMNFSKSIVGYDPFENCGMTDADRRYCFNILAGYCDTDGIRDDGHKIQSVVQITQMQLQCRKLDEFINTELLSTSPDDARIIQLTTTKRNLLSSMSKIAADNNISSNHNNNSKAGKNTLGEKMKEMFEAGYEPIKVNMFDVATSAAMRQIADISNASILSQISLDSIEYSKMINEQREMIIDSNSKLLELEEENRMLKNKLIDLTNSKKKRV